MDSQNSEPEFDEKEFNQKVQDIDSRLAAYQSIMDLKQQKGTNRNIKSMKIYNFQWMNCLSSIEEERFSFPMTK